MRYRFATVFVLVSLWGLPMVSIAQSLTPAQRAALEAQLAAVEAEIAANQSQLSATQRQRTSLERDAAVLDSKITAAQLAIKQRDLLIKRLNGDIGTLQTGIGHLDARVEAGRNSMAQMLRRTHQIDETPLVVIALGSTLSEFLQDIDDFAVISRALRGAFTVMADERSDLASRKEALEGKEDQESQLLKLQHLERQELQMAEKEKKELVSAAKSREKSYQELITAKKQTAAEIRAILFPLADSSEISFGKAYEYAKAAAASTGVRPAFLLGVLTIETSLGQNVGQCLLTNDPAKGNGKGMNTGRFFGKVMHPTRDVDLFIQITAELGIDWKGQRVSCPQSVGYGGAMGPAQFIPSTWVGYADRVATASGQRPANPWNPRTAFIASALYLSDLGADRGTEAAEREAAGRYYAGGNWNGAQGRSYANKVLAEAEKIQAQVDILEGR